MSELEKWLLELELETYLRTLSENQIELSDLPLLTEEDLKHLGIPLGPRRRMQSALQKRETANPVEADEDEAVVPLAGERRQVTVLFADLSGFTKMSGELDAEELHDILNRYFQIADAAIERYGGTIDKHIGDSVMAVFGAPRAHTNDPERAVRAACEINAAMPALSKVIGRDILAHIGIASGQVIASGTGSDAHQEYTVTGETVNLAARLDDLAKPGEILISESVHEAVAPFCACLERGAMTIKGFSAPIRAWAVESVNSNDRHAQSGELIARRMEMRQFSALLQGCIDTHRGYSLLVRGDPGVGKTRLVEEFAAEAAHLGFGVVRSLVLDFGVAQGNDAISLLVHNLLELQFGCGVTEREEALSQAIANAELPEARRVFANVLLNLPQNPELLNLYDQMDNSAREAGSRAVLADLALVRATQKPLLVIIEDIHWADAFALSHLSSLARAIAESNVILVMTSRIEGASMQHDWPTLMSGSPLTIMELQPLHTEDCFALATDMGGTAKKEIEAAVNRSGGNPLFLKLLMRNSIEALDDKLPETLQGLVLARVDRLKRRDKEALQAGSVVGQRLTLGLLQNLISDPQYNCAALVEHRLLKPDGDGFLFDHALIRDGVYSSLLKKRRQALHRRCADWFGETDPTLRAEHLDRAEDHQAAAAYFEAARSEVRRHRNEKALMLADRGLELESDQDTRFRLLCLKGEVLEVLNRFENSISSYKAAAETASAKAELCSALLGQALAFLRLDRHLEAERLLREAEEIATALDLKSELTLIHRRRATIEFARGNAQTSFEESKIALAMAQDCGLSLLEAEALSCMADAEAASGKILSARDYYSQCIEICSKHGFRRFAIINTKMLGDNAFYRGELVLSRKNFSQVVEDAAELGDLRSELLARNMLVYLDCLAAKSHAAIQQAHIVREQILRIDIRRFLMNNYCLLAMAKRSDGRFEDALANLRDAEAIAKDLNVTWAMPWVLGERALSLRNTTERSQCLKEGMALLKAGHGGYFTFEFYRPAIEAALEMHDWPLTEELCAGLSATMGDEPVGFAEYVIRRARAIAGQMQGDDNSSFLQELCDQAVGMEIFVDLPLIKSALFA